MQSPRVESKRSVGAPSARWRPVLQPLVQRAASLESSWPCGQLFPRSRLIART